MSLTHKYMTSNTTLRKNDTSLKVKLCLIPNFRKPYICRFDRDFILKIRAFGTIILIATKNGEKRKSLFF
jgi:hypothetical protein